MRRALVGCLALSVAAPPLGVFLMLRRMSLMGDVLRMASCPGVAPASCVAGLSLAGDGGWAGCVAGLAVALGAGALSRATGGREDASFAALYLVALAARRGDGLRRGGSVELTQLLFGSVLGVDDAALLLMAGIATLTLPALALIWRPLVLEMLRPRLLRRGRRARRAVAHGVPGAGGAEPAWPPSRRSAR